jgi:murein DD-endopeptidase MepM/ murein hydrolase activator NlpD
MNKFILFFIILILIPFVNSNSAMLVWDAPEKNEDGSLLTDLNGFFIYYSLNQFNSFPSDFDIVSCQNNPSCFFINKNNDENKKDYSYILTSLQNTKYFIQVVAIDNSGNYITSNPPPETQSFPEEQFYEIIWPVKTLTPILSSCYGWRILGEVENWHDGIDIALPIGSEVISVADGIVIQTCIDEKNYWPSSKCNPRLCQCRGTYIDVYHPDLGTYAQYNHLSELKVNKNDMIKQGQVIALTGNTGISSGPHLDFKYFFSSNMERRLNNPIGNPLCYLPPIDYSFGPFADSCRDGKIYSSVEVGDNQGGITYC